MAKEIRTIEKQIEHLLYRKLMLELSGNWKQNVIALIHQQIDALELEKARMAAGYVR